MQSCSRREARCITGLAAAVALALLMALEVIEEPDAGVAARLGDLVEVLLTVVVASAVTYWVLLVARVEGSDSPL